MPLTPDTLARQNRDYRGTSGVSGRDPALHLIPAFCDLASQRVVPSRFADGRPAPIHSLDGLPEEWIERRALDGRVVAVIPTVVAGFLRRDRFYTREQAATLATGHGL